MKTFLVAAVIVVALGCSNPFDTSIDVRYEVTGTAEFVNVIYQNDSGGISQVTNVPTPWTVSLSMEPEDYVYLSAQNQGETGSVTVTIFKNGDVFKRATSEGSFVIASVSGTL